MTVPRVLAVTGHRPDRIAVGGRSAYEVPVFETLVRFAGTHLEAHAPTRLITGMALGWDLACAEAAHALGLPYEAFVPCDGQDARWSPGWQRRYRLALARAARVHVVSPGPYARWKPLRRNEAMVEAGDALLALYDGRSDGGTAHCVGAAAVRAKPVHQVWAAWEAWITPDPG